MRLVHTLKYGHDSFVIVEDTGGAMDHPYRARLRDGDSCGSGNTVNEAIASLVANMRLKASQIEQALLFSVRK